MRNRLINELQTLAETDERIWLLTGDLGFNVLEGFEKSFPDRYVNTGIAEQHMMGLASGLALSGKVPFVYSIANFTTLRCLEQIRNDVSYHNLPVRIISIGGGLGYGSAGYSHHAIEDLAIMRTLPNLIVLAPCDPDELAAALLAIKDINAPVYIRVGKGGEENFTEQSEPFVFAKPRILREGSKVGLMTTGTIACEALKSACFLAEEQTYSPRVIALPTLSHLDVDALMESLKDIEDLFLIEEHLEASAFQILYEKAYNHLMEKKIRIHRIFLDKKVCYMIGSQKFLLEQFGLDAKGITDMVRQTIKS